MQSDPSHGVRFIEIPSPTPSAMFLKVLSQPNSPKDWLAELAGPTGRRCTGSWTSSRHRSPPLQRRQRFGNGSRQKLQQCERESNSPIRWRDQQSRIIFCAYRNSWRNSGRRWDFARQPSRRKRRGEHVWTAYKSGLSGAVPVSTIEGLRNYIKVHRHEFADARVSKPRDAGSTAGAPGYVTETDKSEEFSFSDTQFKALCPPGFTVKQLSTVYGVTDYWCTIREARNHPAKTRRSDGSTVIGCVCTVFGEDTFE